MPSDYEKDNEEYFCSRDGVLVMADSSTTGPSPLIGIGIEDSKNRTWEILGDQGTHSCTGFYGLISHDITHWMPIPCDEDDES